MPRTEDPTRVRLTEKEAVAQRYESYENRSLMDRRIMGFNAGARELERQGRELRR